MSFLSGQNFFQSCLVSKKSKKHKSISVRPHATRDRILSRQKYYCQFFVIVLNVLVIHTLPQSLYFSFKQQQQTMLSLSSIHLETKFPEHHISSCSCGTCGSNNNNKSTIPDKIPIETVPPCGCLANGGPGKLTLIELARLERDLDSLPKWLKILRMSTNPIFLLWVMVDLFTKDPREIERRRQVVKMELQQLRSRSILNNEGRMLDKKFTDITAKDLAMVFDLIDREFFGGAIAGL